MADKRIAPGHYLCGCSVRDKLNYSLFQNVEGESLRRKDNEGFLVCPEHGAREYGWRSIEKTIS